MHQSTHATDIEVLYTDLEIPQEVAGSETLDHAASWCVTPQPGFPVHLLSLWVRKDHIQSSTVDEERLNHGDPVNVPVQAGALVKTCVRLWAHEFGYRRRQHV